jgi:hypothetical protein
MLTRILKHDVEFNYFDKDITELPESEEEHIIEMITEGYSSGELNYYDQDSDTEIGGWWEIDFTCINCNQRYR